jgi:flavin reductase (DIM6/NTAB) family NADH-FMN oxidoreductase RutF
MKDAIADLCRELSLGVYVIGASHEGRQDAFTASSVMQASFEPVLLAVSVNPKHASYPLIRGARNFSISVLRRDQMDVARLFGTHSGRDMDKLRNVSWSSGETGAPILDDAMAWFECELTAVMPAGDHCIVLGRVVGGHIVAEDATPMLYADTGNLDGSRRLYRESYF